MPNTQMPVRPLLMIPLRRCGSHALRLRLNLNRDFYSPYPLHLVDLKPLLPLYGDLADDRRFFQLVTDVVGLQAMSLVKWPSASFEPGPLFETLRQRPRSVHSIAFEMLLQSARSQGARVAMDKSLDNVSDWPELTKLFPEMLFLNVIRDPRAQVASMNRAIIHEFDSLLNAKLWLDAVNTADALSEAFPSKVLTVRFEDFIRDEESVLKSICAFSGIAFLPEMLEISRSTEAKTIAAQSALWESNSSAPISANIDKFKKNLTSEEIEQIETVTGAQMDRFGYARLTPGRSPIDEKILAAAKLRSEEKRTAAWAHLKATKPHDFILRRRRADYIEMCRQNLLRQPFA